jgi:hypothetical protein
VIPEEGSPGVINFRCPPSFHDDIVDLQWGDMRWEIFVKSLRGRMLALLA